VEKKTKQYLLHAGVCPLYSFLYSHRIMAGESSCTESSENEGTLREGMLPSVMFVE